MAKNSKMNPNKTIIGPNVRPRNPYPYSSLSNVIIKNPIKIITIPITMSL
tara:strand:+ start:2227 stop:2376 length:150 start_codon:yes stop_codon:yes gene_type:complete